MRTQRAFRAAVTAVTAATMLGLAACGGSDDGSGGTPAAKGGPGGTIRVAVEDLPASWEPWADGDLYALSQVYEPLLHDDGTGKLQPQLATKFEQTKDALDLTLRSGVVFHDGTPFDAEAVKANIGAYQKSASSSGEALNAIERVVVKDDRHVSFELSRPAPDIPSTLAVTLIASPKAIAAGSLKTDPVGTGAWRYDSRASTPGAKIVTTSFDRYWNPDSVHFRRVELVGIEESQARLSAVQTGEVDVADLDRDLIEQVEGTGFAVVTEPLLPQQFVLLRRTGPLADVRVRQAICQGIDTPALAGLLPKGQAKLTTQRFDVGQYGHNPEVKAWKYDPATAKRLLAEAGSPKVDLTMAVQDGNRERGEAIAGQLAKIGVHLKLRAVSPTQYFDTWRVKYPVGLGTVANQETPSQYYRDYISADGAYNTQKVRSPEIDAAAGKAAAQATAAAAEPGWREVARLVHEQAIACNDTTIMENLIFDPKKIAGVAFDKRLVTIDWHAVRPAG